MEIILIKLGGSIITDKKKEYTLRPDVIKRLAKEIKNSKKQVLIAHGSGSFGHTSALRYGGMKGYKSAWGISKVARDAMEINRLVMDILIDNKIPAVSFRPMGMIIAKNGKPHKINLDPLIESLNQNLVPVSYGDVIWDRTLKSTIFSGEFILNLIAENLVKNKFKVKKIIEVGETDGVYDGEGNTLEYISHENFKKISPFLSKNKKDVTGGMKHKVEEALKIGKIGIKTYIINGRRKKELSKTLKGEKSIFSTFIK